MRRPSGTLSLVTIVSATAACSASGTVRARAAYDLQCDKSEIEVENIGGMTYSASGCGHTNVYTCPKLNVCASDNAQPQVAPASGPPEPQRASSPNAPVTVSAHDPPTGAGGFTFRADEDDVRAACANSGHVYASTAPAHATCDGLPAGIGAAARADLTFCSGQLCVVALHAELAPTANLARAVARWRAALGERYGEPTSTTANIPSQCNDDVTPCLVDRSATMRFEWCWPSHEHIALSPQVDDAGKPWVSLSYSNAETGPVSAPGL
jgi:hypothetical protein